MVSPEISIIIPTFNRAKLLQETIDSVYRQTYNAWELLVIDDGSTDETEIVMANWVAKDSRIHFLRRTGSKKGGNVCRNMGLIAAKGTYLIFLDSDDLLTVNCLEKRLKLAQKNKSLDFIVFQGAVFYDEKVTPVFFWNVASDENDLKRFFKFDSPWQTSGPLWNRRFLLDNQMQWDEHLALWQDIDFHLQVLLKKPNYTFSEEAVDYLVRGSSADSLSRISYNQPDKAASRIYFFEKYLMHLKKREYSFQTSFLSDTLFSVLKTCFYQKKAGAFFKYLVKALKKNVISAGEFRIIFLNAVLAICSFNKIINWRFPNSKVSTLINENNTLQKIPVNNIITY